MEMPNDLVKDIEELTLDGLYTDGGHHKQWYLERILLKLIEHGVATNNALEEYYSIEEEDGEEVVHEWEEGIAP